MQFLGGLMFLQLSPRRVRPFRILFRTILEGKRVEMTTIDMTFNYLDNFVYKKCIYFSSKKSFDGGG